jgi:hypothetical protein
MLTVCIGESTHPSVSELSTSPVASQPRKNLVRPSAQARASPSLKFPRKQPATSRSSHPVQSTAPADSQSRFNGLSQPQQSNGRPPVGDGWPVDDDIVIRAVQSCASTSGSKPGRWPEAGVPAPPGAFETSPTERAQALDDTHNDTPSQRHPSDGSKSRMPSEASSVELSNVKSPAGNGVDAENVHMDSIAPQSPVAGMFFGKTPVHDCPMLYPLLILL